ncbi:flexible cuticle protein 12-like [Anoplophora glabripennis]|uniref:flexible cuticle protein 12-like n=1 Tax=Anoplophora glabripennis TaxID=217634 RepID=UPI00087526C6|nr:flexible cuticle protein 12-like [Anoplophora glabripennis]
MKVIIALAVLISVALAAPQRDADAVVTRYVSDNIGIDGYNFAYDTSNGISAQESGQVQNAGREDESIAAQGQFAYTGPDGVRYEVRYIADENGFQPVGAHLPVAP